MKKILPILAFAFLIAGCKKNYSCVCTVTVPNPPQGYQAQHYTRNIGASTYGNAITTCTDLGAQIRTQNGGGNADCGAVEQ
jgi:hypothetical protein